MDVDQDTFIVGRHKLSAGETLSPDLSTYEMLHTLESPWPCLSCDVSALDPLSASICINAVQVLKDNLGSDRKTYRKPTRVRELQLQNLIAL
jgi:ribosome assembly protein RRB1